MKDPTTAHVTSQQKTWRQSRFRQDLDDSRGESRNVFAIFFDVRGFSAFTTGVEAVESASYLKRVYQRAIDEFFAEADFVKPTGDGLFIIVEYNDRNVKERARAVVESAFGLLAAFSTLAIGDPMVNFEVPDKAGIGIARGSACRLISKSKVLDYAGRHINLASRLMDLARPEGLVIDDAFGIDLLSDDTQAKFRREIVAIRGIAETVPPGRGVWVTDDVVVQEGSKRSVVDVEWAHLSRQYSSLKAMRDLGYFTFPLESRPAVQSSIRAVVQAPKGGPQSQLVTYFEARTDELKYTDGADGPLVLLHLDKIAKRIQATGRRLSWPVKLRISYEK